MTGTRHHLAHTLNGHQEPVRLVKFGPDSLMVTADVEMQVMVWQDNELITSLDMRAENPRHRPHDRLRSAAFDPTGKMLFLAAGTRLLAVDTQTGQELWRYHAPEFWPFMLASPQTLEIDTDGGLVASFDNGSFEKRNPDLSLVYRRKNREAPVWFSLDKEVRKLVGSDGHALTVWNLDDGSRAQRQTLEDHAYNFAFSAERGLAMARYADTLVIWSVFSDGAVQKIHLPPSPPILAFEPNGRHFAYAVGPDIAVRLLDGPGEQKLSSDGLRFVSIAFDEVGNLWAGMSDGTVKSWSVD